MKFVIAPDSFKGSRTAAQIAAAIKSGLTRVFPDAEYVLIPMADGGEGTVQSLVDATAGRKISAVVTGPLSTPVTAEFGILGDGITAVIEMAAASGLDYTTAATRNPLTATTYGTGELIRAALDQGVRHIILGLGGSATNDGGAGMAQALGIRLLDAQGRDLERGGAALAHLARIDLTGADPRLAQTEFILAADVTNPLTGPTGASAVFGPQKGATPAMVQELDTSLAHFAAVIQQTTGKDIAQVPGAGAAGGLGAGLLAFTHARLEHGIEIVTRYTHLKERARGADYVFTGEGGIDFQTQYGKTPFGVARATKAVAPNAPVVVLAGNIGRGVDVLYGPDKIDAIFATPSGAKSLAQAIADTDSDVAALAENVGRLLRVRG